MGLLRRSFLKLGGVVVGSSILTRWAEVEEYIPDKLKHEWVEDKNDYYIVRVPDYKTFVREYLDKPTIFLLGERSRVDDCRVQGFVNVNMKHESVFTKTFVDASKHTCEGRRDVAIFAGYGGYVSECGFYGENFTNGVKVSVC